MDICQKLSNMKKNAVKNEITATDFYVKKANKQLMSYFAELEVKDNYEVPLGSLLFCFFYCERYLLRYCK